MAAAWDTVVTAGGETVGDLVVRELRWRAERPRAPPLDRRGLTRLVLHAIEAGRLLTDENEVFLDMVLKYRATAGARRRNAGRGAAGRDARALLHPCELVRALRVGGAAVDGTTLRRSAARVAGAAARRLSREGHGPSAGPTCRGGSSGGA